MQRTFLLFACAMMLATEAKVIAEQETSQAPEAGAQPGPLCIKSAVLEQVAQKLADLQDIPPSSQLIREAREAGVDANPVYAKFGVAGEFESFKAWVEDLKRTADAPLICGRARSGERVVLVAAVRAGALTLHGTRLHAETIAEFRDPFLVVRDERGSSRRIPVDAKDGAMVTLPADWGRPLFVQLVATGPNGPRPIAERWVGKIPEGKPVSQASQASASPESWLMQLRRAAGARTLRSNRLLAREAKSHAEAVCESGKVGHELDPNGDPEARLRKRGIEARVIGEAVARAATPSDALRAIEDSPSHRMTVTDPRFTDVGLGRAEDEKGRTCVVVLLAAWPRVAP